MVTTASIYTIIVHNEFMDKVYINSLEVRSNTKEHCDGILTGILSTRGFLEEGSSTDCKITMESTYLFQYFTIRTENAPLLSSKTARPLQYSIGVLSQARPGWAKEKKLDGLRLISNF